MHPAVVAVVILASAGLLAGLFFILVFAAGARAADALVQAFRKGRL